MIEPIKPFRYITNILRFEGLWPENENHTYLYIAISGSFHFFFTFFFIFSEWYNLSQSRDLKEMVQNMYISLTEINTMVKFINFVVRHKKIKKMLKIIEENFLIKTEEEDKIMRRCIKFAEKVYVLDFIVVGSVIAFAAIVPLLSGLPTLPFPVWLPFDYTKSNLYYWIAYSFNITSIIFHAYTNVANDTLIMFCSAISAAQLEIIGLRLTKLKDFKKIDEELKDLISQYDVIDE